MKKYNLILLFHFLSFPLLAATITWDGEGGDNDWNNALNWVGNNIPLATDDVLLDNSVVSISYTVNLPVGNVSVTINSLTITPQVPATISLILPVTNTSSTAFLATGTGDAIVLNNGAVFRNSSGASSGTPVSVAGSNLFRINNGGRYIHNTSRGHTTGLVANLSAAVGTEDGTFEFDVPGGASFTISASGRTFGNLIFSAVASGGAKNYSASGTGNVTINGNLEINTNATFSYGANTALIIIKKNLLLKPQATFNISTGANNALISVKGNLINEGNISESGSSPLSVIEFSGSTNQQISSTGQLLNDITFSINNTAGVELLSPVILPYNLQLIAGKIKTTSTNLLTMKDNTIYTGGSAASFVEGPMKKIGNDNFDFPVGVGGIYAPVGIINIAGENSADEFIAEYKRANPQSIHGGTGFYAAGIDHISYVEYWSVNQSVGTAVKNVKLTTHALSFCKVINQTFISKWNTVLSQWNNELSVSNLTGTAGLYQLGAITSLSGFSAFGDFTLATNLPFDNNPLPLNLLYFNAYQQDKTSCSIEWGLAEIPLSGTLFELERAGRDQQFKKVRSIITTTEKSYSTKETLLEKDHSFFRLKMISPNGVITYSKILTIIDTENVLRLMTIFPTMVSDAATVTIAAPESTTITLQINDMNGRVIKRWKQFVLQGDNTISLNLGKLDKGVYILTGTYDGGRTNGLKFIR